MYRKYQNTIYGSKNNLILRSVRTTHKQCKGYKMHYFINSFVFVTSLAKQLKKYIFYFILFFYQMIIFI